MDYRDSWCVVKALFFAESSLDPNAISRVGAMGLGQVMPATWEAIMEKYPRWREKMDPWDPTHNILVSLAVLEDIDTVLKNNGYTPTWPLVIASYNWGVGNIVNALQLTASDNYDEIKDNIPNETAFLVARVMMLATSMLKEEVR